MLLPDVDGDSLLLRQSAPGVSDPLHVPPEGLQPGKAGGESPTVHDRLRLRGHDV
jgi:hypothetical protein